MKKILILILILWPAYSWAGEKLHESFEGCERYSLKIAYAPLEDEFWPVDICSDEEFDLFLKEDTRLTEKQITEIKNLPPLNYTCLPLKESGEPDFDLSNWSIIGEGDAIVAINPTEGQIFATGGLEDCVGIAILSPQKTLFAHLVCNIFSSDMGKMLSYEQLPLLLQQLTADERLHSRAILVSSCYSFILADAYTSLRNTGITDISADVGPFLVTSQNKWHIKSSDLKAVLSTFEGEDIEELETTFQQSCCLISGRNLIINAKTGKIYSFSDSAQRYRDDTHILQNWKDQKKFSSKRAENCFTLRDYSCLTRLSMVIENVYEFIRNETSSSGFENVSNICDGRLSSQVKMRSENIVFKNSFG